MCRMGSKWKGKMLKRLKPPQKGRMKSKISEDTPKVSWLLEETKSLCHQPEYGFRSPGHHQQNVTAPCAPITPTCCCFPHWGAAWCTWHSVWGGGDGAKIYAIESHVICDSISMTSVSEPRKLGDNFISYIHNITSQTKQWPNTSENCTLIHLSKKLLPQERLCSQAYYYWHPVVQELIFEMILCCTLVAQRNNVWSFLIEKLTDSLDQADFIK